MIRRLSLLAIAALAAALCVPLLASPASAATAVRSGNWGTPSTWGGQLPDPGEAVTIGAGRTVTITTRVRAGSVTVRAGGTLAMPGTSRARLTVTRGVTVGGLLRIRSTGLRQRIMLEGGSGLEVVGAGRLDVVGAAKTAWTRTGPGGAARGARSITLERAPFGWRRGDHLIVVPSAPPTTGGFATGFDEVRVRSVAGTRVTLDRTLARSHPATGPGRTLRPEVLNLTRSVVIGGRPSAHGYVTVESSRPQRVNYAGLRWSGQRGVTGHYGLHFHRNGNGSRGSQVVGTVVRNGGNHAFVSHNSHGIRYRLTISYDTVSDAYWWDPDNSQTRDVSYDWTVAAKVAASGGASRFRNSGYRMMQGTGNQARNTVAVGVQGEVDASGYHWPEEGDPHGEWGFVGNVSHNNAVDGIFNWQNDSRRHDLRQTTLYHNGEYGLDHGAYLNEYHFAGLTAWGNGEAGINLRAASRGSRGLRFADLLVHGAGISEHGLVADDHTLASQGGPTRMAAAQFAGARGAQLRMSPADEPYSLAVTGSNLRSWQVSGGGNRLTVNGRRLTGSGTAPDRVRLGQPGAVPLAPVPQR